ncbi:MAG: DUF4123 domain-containing protein [Tannerella sp.]|jgi:hypothetical protein|nr:DUF4123 domain-containing protein [Tannerella sp.]
MKKISITIVFVFLFILNKQELYGQSKDGQPDVAGSAKEINALLPNYVLIDGALWGEEVEEAKEKGYGYYPLFRGLMYEKLKTVSPYIFSVKPNSSFEEWVRLRSLSEEFRVTWLYSSIEMKELRNHLRQFLRIKTESGYAYFRFYDPYVINAVFQNLPKEQITEFFKNITCIITDDIRINERRKFYLSPDKELQIMTEEIYPSDGDDFYDEPEVPEEESPISITGTYIADDGAEVTITKNLGGDYVSKIVVERDTIKHTELKTEYEWNPKTQEWTGVSKDKTTFDEKGEIIRARHVPYDYDIDADEAEEERERLTSETHIAGDGAEVTITKNTVGDYVTKSVVERDTIDNIILVSDIEYTWDAKEQDWTPTEKMKSKSYYDKAGKQIRYFQNSYEWRDTDWIENYRHEEESRNGELISRVIHMLTKEGFILFSKYPDDEEIETYREESRDEEIISRQILPEEISAIKPVIRKWLKYRKLDLSQSYLRLQDTSCFNCRPDTGNIYFREFSSEHITGSEGLFPALEYSPNKRRCIDIGIRYVIRNGKKYECHGCYDDSQEIFLIDLDLKYVNLIAKMGISQRAEAVFWKNNDLFIVVGLNTEFKWYFVCVFDIAKQTANYYELSVTDDIEFSKSYRKVYLKKKGILDEKNNL